MSPKQYGVKSSPDHAKNGTRRNNENKQKIVNQAFRLPMTLLKTWLAQFVSLTGVFALLLAGVAPVAGQALSETWTLVGQIGGITQAVAIDGNTAYAGIGLKLSLLNVTNPANPVLLGFSQPFADSVQDIAVAGSRAYVAAGGAGIGIVDVTDTAHPNILGTWVSSGYAEGIAVSGTTVYLADGPYGLRVIDASNPSNPIETGSAFTFNYAFDVAVSGNYAYLAAGGSGLLIANIADPSHPVEVGRQETHGYAYGVAVSGSTAYIADAWEGVQVVDISNPANPTLQGNTATPGWALSVAVSGTTLYVGDGGDGLRVLNVSKPTAPYEVGAYEGDGFVLRIAAAGNMVYLADNEKGLRIVNASNPAAPTQVGVVSQMTDAQRVTVSGSYAYVAGGNEGNMYIMNVADPTNPYQVGKFIGSGGIANGIAISGSYVYLSIGEGHYMWVVNVSDPTNPVQTALIDFPPPDPGDPRDLALQGNYVYVADESGMRIFDISTPASIQPIGLLRLPDDGKSTVDLSLSGSYAYLADESDGVRIVNVADPSNPKLVSTFPTSNSSYAVAAANNQLYAGYSGGIQVADITNPTSSLPILGSYALPGDILGLTVAGSELFVSEGLGGVDVLDVSVPTQISQFALLETPGYAWQTELVGNLLYVADGSGGLLIFQKQAGSASIPPSLSGNLGQATQEASPFQNNIGKDLPIQPTEASLQPVEAGQSSKTLPQAGVRVTTGRSCVVTTTADSGAGSLRQGLAGAASGDIITFNTTTFPPGSPATIHLTSQLPELDADSVTIDASNAGVILDGGNSVQNGLYIASSYNTIMGLQIRNFALYGICISGWPGYSQYNQIGGDHTLGSGPSGQGNVIDGTLTIAASGIVIGHGSHNTIMGNFVGTNASGTAAGSGNYIGIGIDGGEYNQIGGPAAGEKNIISNNRIGIDIHSVTTEWNVVAGNYVGTDITSNQSIPNYSGVIIEYGRNNVIGGTTPAERNVISGNNGEGVVLAGFLTTQNTVIGNFIGVNAAGTAALPNGMGVDTWQSAFNRIGGTRPGEGNLISGNNAGVVIDGFGRTDTILIGNRIGLDASGNATLGNQCGVCFSGMHSFIGGLGSGEGNVIGGNGTGVDISWAGTSYTWVAGNAITGNTHSGIIIHSYASRNVLVRNSITLNGPGVNIWQGTGNTLRANSISANPGVGIWLAFGGNQMLAAPAIINLTEAGVSGTACANCTVEVFSDPGSQGLRYEGFTTADPTGAFTFNKRLLGPNVTTTATDSVGNTSPFSAPSGISWTWFNTYLPLVIRNGP